MLTVVYFSARDPDPGATLALGRAMNTIWPEVFDETSFSRRGLRCEVEDSSDWQAHVHEITRFTEDFGEMFARAAKLGIAAIFDTAVWPEDRAAQGRVRLVLPPPLLAALGACGAVVFVSDYVGSADRRAADRP